MARCDQRVSKFALARAYLEVGQYDRSVALLEEWVVSAAGQSGSGAPGPGVGEAYGVLAMGCRGQNRLEYAAEYIRKALELKPDNLVYLNNYGVILAESDKIAEARIQWEKVLRLDPENATARQNLSAFKP